MPVRTVLTSIFVAILLLVLSETSHACTCLMQTNVSLKKQVKEAKKKSHAVFSGEVLEISEYSNGKGLLVRVRVESIWKGVQRNEVMILTNKLSSLCGYEFEVGQKYLIYARQATDGQLYTGLCDRNALLSNSAKDIALLSNKLK